ncbi:MAG: hypothetical protein P4N59_09955 [Negativicutes bacterium]|nr:hypothetical protein [Negativicutes bacterium]
MFTLALATWTGPVLLFNESHHISSESVYRDPVTLVSHVLVYNTTARHPFHIAINDLGQILYRADFDQTYSTRAVIRGAGDGKHLLAALSYGLVDIHWTAINFTESFDGGRTWTRSASIPIEGKEKGLQDMIYIAETGRVLILMQNYDKEIRAISRAPGSSVFSVPCFVGKPMYESTYGQNFAQAAYNMWMNKPIIHVTYRGSKFSDGLYYVRSNNNGVSWTTVRQIQEKGDDISGLTGLRALGQRLFVSYSTLKPHPYIKLFYTDDYGQNFSPVVAITKGELYHDNAELAVCSDRSKSAMVSLMLTGYGTTIAYSLLNTTSLNQTRREYPLVSHCFEICAVDCGVDADRSLINVSTFVEVLEYITKLRYLLYFVGDSSPLPV